MNVSTTKRRVGVIGLAVALLSTTACSIDTSTQPAPTAQAPEAIPGTSTGTTVFRPTATVDELVRVGDERLHVRCVGAGETTVVLIAGFNDGGDNWGRVTPALSRQARVCSYARFGTGASDPPTTPPTFATSARDLHALLKELGEPGPYVVVGHSYGGAQAVTFAARYPAEVDGLLLLDVDRRQLRRARRLLRRGGRLRRTLITNPGGPGRSGVEFLGNDGKFSDEVNRRFDIVSWDPRGVGGSVPLQCGSGFSDTFLSTDRAPRDAAGREALEASLAANVEPCVKGDASLLAHIGTDPAVSDLEAIRLALGGDQITYVGFSYGTLIGLPYAQRFPDGLRAMVLDGVVEPEANLGERLVATATSLDRSLADILNACGPDCPITGDPLQAYRDLAEAVRTKPLRSGDGTDVGFNAVGMAGIAVTYDDEFRAPFYEAIAHCQRGDGTLFELFAEGFVEEFELGPNFAVDCIDVPHPTTSAEVERLASQAADAATVLPELSGAYVRVFALLCLYWPVPAPTELEPVTASGAPPILVVGNTAGPVAPFESAERVASSIKAGVLLTYVGSGHTTYGKNGCADAHIDSYLLDPSLPPEGASCR